MLARECSVLPLAVVEFVREKRRKIFSYENNFSTKASYYLVSKNVTYFIKKMMKICEKSINSN